MEKPADFEQADGYARYVPVGEVTLQQGGDMVTLAIAFAREQGIANLFVDTTRLTGFPPPTMLDRYLFGGQFARAARGAVRVALVARPENLDPKRFGLTVARNRGMIAEVFTDEAAALAWLVPPSP